MKIKFFAYLKEELGDGIEITITAPTTILELKKLIIEKLGIKAEVLNNPSILSSINFEYSKNEAVVSTNDEVAFFPPVTGG